MMINESDLIEKLLRIESLWKGATTPGERAAAGAARARVQARLEELRDHEIEYRFSLHDPWSRKLFLALARSYGLKPYRYRRQHRTTVVLRVSERFVDETLWPHFSALERELHGYLASVTDRVVQQALQADTAEANEQRVPAQLSG